MTTDDLSRPLGQETAPKRRRLRIDLLLLLSGLAALGAAIVIGWVVLVDDPFGGEPTAVARIEALERSEETAVPAPAPPETEPLLDPAEIAARTRIIDPETGEVDGPAAEPPPAARERVSTLAPAPDARLVETSRHGTLPRIGDDGSRPADIYARPVVRVGGAAPSARIAVVIAGLGLSPTATESAIQSLPGAVTLAFAPYGSEVSRLASSARQDGHETLLQIPLEPFDFPDNDPGPKALLTTLSPEQNRDRLHWVLSRFAGYAGTMPLMGARFTASDAALSPLLSELRDRGLFMLDDGAAPRSRIAPLGGALGLQAARAETAIDAADGAAAIDATLGTVEEQALSDGTAILVAPATPVAVERIARWAASLEERGIALAPASALMPRPAS